MFRSFLIIILFGAVFTGHAQTPAPVFPEPSPNGRHVPKLTTAPDGTLVLTYAERRGQEAHYMVSVSDNGGISFSTPMPVDTAPFGAAILQRQPYVVMDATGTMHVLVEVQIGVGERGLAHKRSTDRGATWSDPVRIAPSVPARPQDFGSIAIGTDGTIHATYISVLAESDGYIHIFHVRSTDGGRTWSNEARVDRFPVGGCCECCNQIVSVTPRGEIVVAFRSNIMNRRDIYITRSADGGRTFSESVLIQSEPWYIEGCPGTGPSIAIDTANTLHLVWRDARNAESPGSLYYAQLSNGSTATPPNVHVNPPLGTDGEYPIVATDPSGERVGITWFANDGVYQSIRIAANVERTQLSSQALVNPGVHIAWQRSGFITLWQEDRSGTADLVMMRTDITSHVNGDSHYASDHHLKRRFMYVDLLGRIYDAPPLARWWMRVPRP